MAETPRITASPLAGTLDESRQPLARNDDGKHTRTLPEHAEIQAQIPAAAEITVAVNRTTAITVAPVNATHSMASNIDTHKRTECDDDEMAETLTTTTKAALLTESVTTTTAATASSSDLQPILRPATATMTAPLAEASSTIARAADSVDDVPLPLPSPPPSPSVSSRMRGGAAATVSVTAIPIPKAASEPTARIMITKDRPLISAGKVEIDVSALSALLQCSLCQGCFREPYTTTKCLHTFCKSCFCIAASHDSHGSIVSSHGGGGGMNNGAGSSSGGGGGNNSSGVVVGTSSSSSSTCYTCPTCHTYLGGKDLAKSARPDRMLQDLIDKVLFPAMAAQDAAAEAAFYRQRGISRKGDDNDDDQVESNGSTDEDNLSGKGHHNDSVKLVSSVPHFYFPQDQDDSDKGGGSEGSKDDENHDGTDESAGNGLDDDADELFDRDDDGIERPRKMRRTQGTQQNRNNQVTFYLHPHPTPHRDVESSLDHLNKNRFQYDQLQQLPQLSNPYIHTDGSIRIGQLKKYLAMQSPIRDSLRIARSSTRMLQVSHHAISARSTVGVANVHPSLQNINGNDDGNKGNRGQASADIEPNFPAKNDMAHANHQNDDDDEDDDDCITRSIVILCNGIPLGNELNVTFILRTVWMNPKDEILQLTYRYSGAGHESQHRPT